LLEWVGGSGKNLRDVGKLELSELVVVLGHRTLTLEDLNEDHGLIVCGGREDLGLLGGDRSTTLDQSGHDTASGLNTKGQWVDIHKDDLSSTGITSENTSLNGGTIGNSLIGVDVLASLLSEELLEHGLNLRDTGRTSNKDDVIDIALLHLGVLENLLNRLESLLEQIIVQLFELGAGQSLGEILALEKGLDLNLGGLLGGEGTLGLLDLTLQLTHGLLVLGDVNILVLVVLLGQVVDDTLIEILTTEMGITSGSLDLENTFLEGQDGDIESSTSEIVDNDLTFLLASLVESVCKSGSGGFVDNTEDVESGNGSGVLGGGTLGVIEVGGDGDNGVLDGLAEISLSNLLHLAQNHGGDFLGGESGILLVDGDLDVRLSALVDDGEGEMLDIILNFLLVELTADKTFLPRCQYSIPCIPKRWVKLTISKMVREGLLAN
jgi:hypothetical protein